MPFSPRGPFPAYPAIADGVVPHESPDDFGAAPDDGVSGIVLAGSHRGGDGAFERVLRGPLIPVAQSPVICYPLAWLRSGGVRAATICANSQTPHVQACLGHGARLGLELDYYADHSPRGPAGCAHDAARLSAAHTFVVVEGSLIPSLDLRALLAVHRAARAAATVVVEIDRRRRGTGGERPRLPGGIYVFDRRVLEGVAERGYHDIKQGLIERLHADRERVAIHEVAGVSPRVLDSAGYASVNSWLITRAAQRPAPLLDGYQPRGQGLHHSTASVHPDARLIGPVLLGPSVRIEADAVIVGPTSVGAGSVIQSGALVSRSVLWAQCVVGAHAIVDSSVLADHSHVGAGERVFSAVEASGHVAGTGAPMHLPERAEDRPHPAIAAIGDLLPATAAVRLPPDFVSPVPTAMPARHSSEVQSAHP